MRDSRQRFTATAEDYRRYRPTYPPALLDFLLGASRVPAGGRVADVGCGTGIATRLLAERGHDVVGIDPNEAMLRQARSEPGGRYVRAEASLTGLRDAAVDLVTVAQAFHWFPVEETLREFRRILKPGGVCAVFWNRRASTPFMDAYDALLQRRVEGFSRIPRPEKALSQVMGSSLARDVREGAFAHVQLLDLPGLLGRAHSSSYVAHEVSDREALDSELSELFERYAGEGSRVSFEYRAVGLVFRIA